jgi:hypothetical protein
LVGIKPAWSGSSPLGPLAGDPGSGSQLRGAKKVAATLTDAGFDCFRVVFLADMDANDYWVKRSPGPDGFERLLRQATWLSKGKAKPAVVIPAVPRESASLRPS